MFVIMFRKAFNAFTFLMLDLAAEIIQGYQGNLSWQKEVVLMCYIGIPTCSMLWSSKILLGLLAKIKV